MLGRNHKNNEEQYSMPNAQLNSFSVGAALKPLAGEALDLLARKLIEDEGSLGLAFPIYTDAQGSWVTQYASVSAGYTGDAWSHGNWHCGFWVGLLLASHIHTGEARYLELARERLRLIEHRANDPHTHDIGFIFDSSAIPAWYLTGERDCAETALRAAKCLRARIVATASGAYVSSWGPLDDPRGRSSSAIDTMANLPLLYWASDYSGDASFRLAAQAHADFTWTNFVRPNRSTYHAVEYDTVSGARLRGYTFQGYGDESDWSRGQAWAIYGFTQSWLESTDRRYVEHALELTDYYLERLGDDPIPPWDFDAPAASDRARDTATTAIVASALLDLAANLDDPQRAAFLRDKAEWMLAALCSDYLARDPAQRGLLTDGCYSMPHRLGERGATLFGDFYFVEALCKLLYPGRMRPAHGARALSLPGTEGGDHATHR
jgi:unsaturated chondroitin disaccharide hydrolase